jgi:hypothetical protein
MLADVAFRVAHLPGDENPVADALSSGELERAYSLVPCADFSPFIPPPKWLGDEWI